MSIFSFSRNAFNCEFSSCTPRFIEKTMKYHVGNNIQIRNWQKSIYTLKIHLKTRRNNGNGNSSHSIHNARWKGYNYYFMQNSSLDMAINAIVTLQNKWTQSNHVNEIQNDKFLSTFFYSLQFDRNEIGNIQNSVEMTIFGQFYSIICAYILCCTSIWHHLNDCKCCQFWY